MATKLVYYCDKAGCNFQTQDLALVHIVHLYNPPHNKPQPSAHDKANRTINITIGPGEPTQTVHLCGACHNDLTYWLINDIVKVVADRG